MGQADANVFVLQAIAGDEAPKLGRLHGMRGRSTADSDANALQQDGAQGSVGSPGTACAEQQCQKAAHCGQHGVPAPLLLQVQGQRDKGLHVAAGAHAADEDGAVARRRRHGARCLGGGGVAAAGWWRSAARRQGRSPAIARRLKCRSERLDGQQWPRRTGASPRAPLTARRRFRRALINVRTNQEEERRDPSANEGALGEGRRCLGRRTRCAVPRRPAGELPCRLP